MIGFGPLKRLLKERGMTYEQLSIAMGRSPVFIGAMLGGDYPLVSTVCEICSVLGCDINDVVEYVDFKDRRATVNWDILGKDIRNVMSIQKMAVSIGKSKDSLYQVEKRKGTVMLSDLKKICGVIGTSEDKYIE